MLSILTSLKLSSCEPPLMCQCFQFWTSPKCCLVTFTNLENFRPLTNFRAFAEDKCYSRFDLSYIVENFMG